jgi:hypothetical protein
VDVLSQKFQFVGKNYTISVHCFFDKDLEEIIGSDFEKDLVEGQDTIRVVRDFKQMPFEHAVCRQKNSSGDLYEYVVPIQKKVDGGFIAQIPAYIVFKGRLYPGLYQNLISPEFNDPNKLKDRDTIKQIRVFKGIFMRQMDKERKLYNGGFSKSHTRSLLFAPMKYS